MEGQNQEKSISILPQDTVSDCVLKREVFNAVD